MYGLRSFLPGTHHSEVPTVQRYVAHVLLYMERSIEAASSSKRQCHRELVVLLFSVTLEWCIHLVSFRQVIVGSGPAAVKCAVTSAKLGERSPPTQAQRDS